MDLKGVYGESLPATHAAASLGLWIDRFGSGLRTEREREFTSVYTGVGDWWLANP